MPKRTLALVVPLGLLSLWYGVTASGLIPTYQLASPVQVARELVALAQDGTLWNDLVASVTRVVSGFLIAAALACILGTVVGLSPKVERSLDPTLQAIRAVPSLAWVPLILLWLGIGENAKITLVAIGAFFPVYVNLVAGIHNVDRKLVEVAQIFGVRGVEQAWRVIVPAASPHLFVGLRVGFTQAWLFLVAAELLASTKGLGYLLVQGQQITRPDQILVAILLLALCGKLTESGMRAIEKRALRWTDSLGAAS
ncbi:MAG: ABC transporter permease [Candidatus Eremiobacteraeota bacterium]|nr:ABC transporter permease [Candidatus Eremiobacteraeota bacterium]